MDYKWHIWVIRKSRYDDAVRLLDSLPQVREYLYPTAIEEYKTKGGKRKTKSVPLYSGYIYINYHSHPQVFQLLTASPFFTTYTGSCSAKDVEPVREVKRLEEWQVSSNKQFSVDDLVVVNAGPFKGFTGRVVRVTSSKVHVMLEILGRRADTALDKADADKARLEA